jgi:hypothetical protein
MQMPSQKENQDFKWKITEIIAILINHFIAIQPLGRIYMRFARIIPDQFRSDQ